MKREFLQEFKVAGETLPKEVIDAIMAENGRDIQKVRGNFSDYEDMKAELTRLQALELEQQSHREEAAAWEQKYLQAERQLMQQEFDHRLDSAITRSGGRSVKAISALLDLETLRQSQDRDTAIAEALERLKQDSAYLFAPEYPPQYARFTGTQTGERNKAPATLAGALMEKFERK